MRTRMRILAATALIAVALTGCAASDDSSAGSDGGAETAPESAGGTGVDADAPADAERSEASGGDLSDGAIGVGGDLAGRKVIRGAELELEVEDPQIAAERITAAAERAGGFVSDQNLTRFEDRLSGSITIRVPSDRLSVTLTDLEQLADRVAARRISSQDVTGEYSDITSQLRNLRAVETELLTLLTEVRTNSGSTEQVLIVFERLREIRSEIERLQGRQQVLDDRVDLATVAIFLTPTDTVVTADWRPVEVVREALAATVSALQSIADLAIWLVLTILPVLVLTVGPLALVAWWLRRRTRPHAPTA